MNPVIEESPLVHLGQTKKVTLPSGKQVTIRETNGEDDDIISRVADASDGSNILNFLASIIMTDHNLGRKPVVAEIAEYKANDKYYLVFKQRLMNHGPELEFEYTCQNPKCKKTHKYEEDLRELDGDLSDPEYKPKHIASVKKYPQGDKAEIEFITSSGKTIRYKILNSLLEKKQLDMPQNNLSKNTMLLAREIELFIKQEWVLQTYFGAFTSREMGEIRKHVTINDDAFDPHTEFECYHCKQPYSLPILSLPAFYYPADMI